MGNSLFKQKLPAWITLSSGISRVPEAINTFNQIRVRITNKVYGKLAALIF